MWSSYIVKKMLKTILSDNNLVEFITNTEEEMTNRLEIRNNIENGLNSLNSLHKTINWNSINEELSKTNWEVLETEVTKEILNKLLTTLEEICTTLD